MFKLTVYIAPLLYIYIYIYIYCDVSMLLNACVRILGRLCIGSRSIWFWSGTRPSAVDLSSSVCNLRLARMPPPCILTRSVCFEYVAADANRDSNARY